MLGDNPEVKISIASLHRILRTSSDYSSPAMEKSYALTLQNQGWANRAARSPPASWQAEKRQLTVNTLQKPLISISRRSLGLHR